MTSEERQVLIERWLSSKVETLEDKLADPPITDDRLGGDELVWESQHEHLHETMASNDYRTVSPEVNGILKDAGLAFLDHDSLESKKLCRRLLRAKIELVGIDKKRVHGNYPVRQLPSPASWMPTRVVPHVKPSPLFSVIAKKYLAEKPRAKRTTEQDILITDCPWFPRLCQGHREARTHAPFPTTPPDRASVHRHHRQVVLVAS